MFVVRLIDSSNCPIKPIQSKNASLGDPRKLLTSKILDNSPPKSNYYSNPSSSHDPSNPTDREINSTNSNINEDSQKTPSLPPQMHLINEDGLTIITDTEQMSNILNSGDNSKIMDQDDSKFKIGVMNIKSVADGPRKDDYGKIILPGQQVVILLDSSEANCIEYINRFDKEEFLLNSCQINLRRSDMKKKKFFDSAEYFSKDGKIQVDE